jgi:outer membrane protein assembly factor BamB
LRKTALCLISAMFFLSALFVMPVSYSSEPGQSEDFMLFDMGDGHTVWTEINSTGSYAEVSESCAASANMEFMKTGSEATINGIENITLPGRTVSWTFYSYSDNGWTVCDSDGTYGGGSFAWGFYPEGLHPSETPSHKDSWTMYRGAADAAGTSDSPPLEEPASPVEWYRTYSDNGYVDSGLLVSENRLYHTSDGHWDPDFRPALHCIDTDTGKEIWSFSYAGSIGYEVSTPAIVGDMIVLTASNRDIYGLDCVTGDLLWTETLPYDPPVSDGESAPDWDGRTFVTGATTPVYFRGAIYFGTDDGKTVCASVSREGCDILWEHVPTGEARGCYYYHAPILGSVNGKSMLFIGGYSGYVHALDALTGEQIWELEAIRLMGNNILEEGTPGSSGHMALGNNGSRDILVVSCTDGALSPRQGHILYLDAETGDELNRIAAWSCEPTVSEEGIYVYVNKVPDGDWASGVYLIDWEGNPVWKYNSPSWIKSPLTLAGGCVYFMDYSTGTMYPTGGCLTSLNAETGEENWRMLLTPTSSVSYSMVQPTVINGKIYAGNDYGAVYCLSNIPGAGQDDYETGPVLVSTGFNHWSWYLFTILFTTSLASFIILYRRV